MKVLILNLNGKTYTTGKITAYLSRQALKIQKDALEIAKKGKEMEEKTEGISVEETNNLLDSLEDLRNRKSWLICEMYQNKFSPDELEKFLDDDEIDSEINNILTGITGIISKN
jgi:23S rRNA pseudoU1915 N3-methylase RlmH